MGSTTSKSPVATGLHGLASLHVIDSVFLKKRLPPEIVCSEALILGFFFVVDPLTDGNDYRALCSIRFRHAWERKQNESVLLSFLSLQNSLELQLVFIISVRKKKELLDMEANFSQIQKRF